MRFCVRKLLSILAFFFLCKGVLFAEEELEPQISMESDPSAWVDGRVNAITGKWREQVVDLLIEGKEPIIIRRKQGEGYRFPRMHRTNLCVNKTCYNIKDDFGVSIRHNRVKETLYIGSKKYYKYVPVDLADGYTNTGRGEISSRTNPSNNILWVSEDEKYMVLWCADGTEKTYCRMRRKHHDYRLESAHLPNGNWILYFYKEVTLRAGTSSEKIETNLVRIETRNPKKNQIYAYADFLYEDPKRKNKHFYIKGSDGKQVEYRYGIDGGRTRLKEVISSDHPDHTLSYYPHFPYVQREEVCSRVLPSGRVLLADYYSDQDTTVLGQSIVMQNEWWTPNPHQNVVEWHYTPDPRCGRVKTLASPVGEGSVPEITHFFLYDLPNRQTAVYDIEGKKTLYHWDPNSRLDRVEHYTKSGKRHDERRFVWDSQGRLLCSSILDENLQPILALRYTYNARGDVVEERLFGNLSGKGPPLVLNAQNMPVEGGVESFGKRSTYMFTGRVSLLLSEEDDRGKRIEYTYLPGTDCRTSEILYEKNRIVKRTFWKYNADTVLVQEIVDDGSGVTLEECQGVRVRRIREITPSTIAPYIGMPQSIRESYWGEDGEVHPLLTHRFSYTGKGKIATHAVFDAKGDSCYKLQYQYDAKGNLIEHTDPIGNVYTARFDPCGNKIFATKPSSQGTLQIEYTYDCSDRLRHSRQTGSDGIVLDEYYLYDSQHRLLVEQKPLGESIAYRYDDFGFLQEKECTPLPHASGSTPVVFSYAHDALGHCTKIVDPGGEETQVLYSAYGKPTRVVYPDNSVEEHVYALHGLVSETIAPDGTSTLYDYDALDRLLEKRILFHGVEQKRETWKYGAFSLVEEMDAEGQITLYSYDGAGRLIGTQKGKETSTYGYDPLGHQDREQKGNVCTRYEKDFLDRTLQETKEDEKGDVFFRERYAYDSVGNLEKTYRYGKNEESVEEVEFDSLSRPIQHIDPLGNVTKIAYEHTPTLREVITDPQGLCTIKTYHPQKTLASTEIQGRDGTILRFEEYFYDYQKHLVEHRSQIFSPIQSLWTLQKYDNRGRCIELIEAAGSLEERRTKYTYDVVGRLALLQKPNGVSLAYTYTPLGHIETLTSSDGTIDHLYTHNRLGQMCVAEDRVTGKKTTRQYDPNGHLVREEQGSGAFFEYTYDNAGQKTSMTLPDLSSVRYEYAKGQLFVIARRDRENQPLYSHTFLEYDLQGNLLQEQLPANLGTVERQYNAKNQLDELHTPHFLHSVVERDPRGNATKLLQDRTLFQYQYDDLSQLTQEDGPYFHEYIHDAHQAPIQQDLETYQTNHLLQIPSHSTYDANGNTLQERAHQYTYDALDRLVQVTTPTHTVHYTYDCMDRRIQKTVYTLCNNALEKTLEQYFLYEEQKEIGACSVHMQIEELRILGRRALSEQGASVALELHGHLYVPLHDIAGNMLVLLSSRSNSSNVTYQYSAFQEENPSSHSLNPWRYASKRTDPETGLVYFGRRYYVPTQRRWLTPDPKGQIDGINLYAFVQNNPLRYNDPYGLYSDDRASSVHFEDSRPSAGQDSHSRVGDPGRGTISYGCGINNSDADTRRAIETLYEGFDRIFSIQSYQLHKKGLIHGLALVGLGKLSEPSILGSAVGGILTPVLAQMVLQADSSYEAMEQMRQDLAAKADDILAQNNDRLKQVCLSFSQGGYLTGRLLSHMTKEQRDTLIVITVGSTKILDKDLAHKVINIIGDKDWPSQVCNGGRREVEKRVERGEARWVAQSETESYIGGHYFLQKDYQNHIKNIIQKEVVGSYEIR